MNWKERKAIYNEEYYDGDLEGHYRDWWWTDFAVWGPRARVVYEAFRPESVLVCGCAKGSLVKFLRGVYGIDAKGFDLSSYAIESTPYKDISDYLLVHDLAVEPLPYDDHEFDVVTCYDFIEHNDNDHIQFVVSEVARVAKRIILIRSPMVNLNEQRSAELIQLTLGLPYKQRDRILKSNGYWNPLSLDPSNAEHPNTLERGSIAMLFDEFSEIYLDSYFYDIMMGSNLDRQTPVLPFYDTMVLNRETA